MAEKWRTIFLIVFVITSALPEDVSTSSVVRLCGRKLVNAMKALCNHRYVTPESPSLSSYNHLSVYKSGIVEHCCSRPCSYNYLKSFCDDEPTTSTTQLTTEASDHYDQEFESSEFVERVKEKLSKKSHNANSNVGGQVKTFRSLFHLLAYISDIWNNMEQAKNDSASMSSSTSSEV